jgi:hypothetical protein
MEQGLRNRLWDVLAISYWGEPRRENYLDSPYNSVLRDFLEKLWHLFFKKPMDTIPGTWVLARKQVREYFFDCVWYEVYDFLEFAAANHSRADREHELIQRCNAVLESELSGYRFVDGSIVPITADEEVDAIENAIGVTAQPFPGVSEHIKQAVSLLARRPEPDYRNSIKESISAVEGLCAAITGDPKATLGAALKVIDSEAPLHPALRSAFDKLYGYTSDAEGIRHSLMEEPNLQQEDAVFMMVACSAFTSYVIAKRARKKSG